MDFAQGDSLQDKILKKLPLSRRLRIAFELNDFARQRLATHLKEKDTRVSSKEILRLVKKRFER